MKGIILKLNFIPDSVAQTSPQTNFFATKNHPSKSHLGNDLKRNAHKYIDSTPLNIKGPNLDKFISPDNSRKAAFDKYSKNPSLNKSLLQKGKSFVTRKKPPIMLDIEVFLNSETFRLNAKEIASSMKYKGELKKHMIITQLVESISNLLNSSVNTLYIQIRGYEIIADILIIYKDYVGAIVYLAKGVFFY